MTRRKARKLHSQARQWYMNGIHWEGGSKVAAPSGPMRIAFDAGMRWEKARRAGGPTRGLGHELPLDVWVRVYADYIRSY